MVVLSLVRRVLWRELVNALMAAHNLMLPTSPYWRLMRALALHARHLLGSGVIPRLPVYKSEGYCPRYRPRNAKAALTRHKEICVLEK